MSRRTRAIGGLTVLGMLLLCCISGAAQAFGALGHRLIGELAAQQLNPSAAGEVKRLLGGQTLAQIAPWADEIRDQRRETAPWHYMNFSAPDCSYQPEVDCPKGNCLIRMLQAQLALLRDKQQSTEVRAEALRFVVHLFGDAHQPLHLGYAVDKGGNDFQIAFDQRASASPQASGDDPQAAARAAWWKNRIQGYNLHSLWDTQLLESAALSESDYLKRLQALPSPGAGDASIEDIATQSCLIMRRDGFYPPRHRIGRDYVDLQRPVAQAQLRLAGDRLATLLNQTLGR